MSSNSERPDQISPPFGFESVMPLAAGMRLKPWDNIAIPSAFAKAHALPLCAGESLEAARSFPLVFGSGDVMVAVLGLEKDENLFMHDGQWEAAAYMPAAMRRYPFCTSNVRVDGVLQDQALVCVESSFVAKDSTSDGVSITDANGQPTPEFAVRNQFVQSFDADLRATMRLINYLNKLGLLKEFNVTAKLADGTDFQVGGMLRVDTEVLRVQPAKDLRALIENGGMALIYTHLNSLPNFDRLLARKYPAAADASGAAQGAA
jgi:SapC